MQPLQSDLPLAGGLGCAPEILPWVTTSVVIACDGMLEMKKICVAQPCLGHSEFCDMFAFRQMKLASEFSDQLKILFMLVSRLSQSDKS